MITSRVCQKDLTKKEGTFPTGMSRRKHFLSRQLLLTWYQWGQGLSKSPWASFHLLKGEAADGCLGVGRSCCGGPEVRKTLASQLHAAGSVSTPWEAGGEQAVPIVKADLPRPENPINRVSVPTMFRHASFWCQPYHSLLLATSHLSSPTLTPDLFPSLLLYYWQP